MKTIPYIFILLSTLFFIRCHSDVSNLNSLNSIDILPKVTYEIMPSIKSISANDSFFVAVSNKTCETFLFDRNLSITSSFGVKGKGPQELLCPTSIFIDSYNNIYILDITKMVIFHFKDKGIFISENKLNSNVNQGKLCFVDSFYYYHTMDEFSINKVNMHGEFVQSFGSFFPSDNVSKKYYHNAKMDILPYMDNIIAIICQHSVLDFYDTEGGKVKTYKLNALEDFFSELREIYSKGPLSKSSKFAIINILDSSIDGNKLFLLLSRAPEKPEEVFMNTIVVVDLQNQKLEYLIRLPDEIYMAFVVKNRKCLAYSYDKSELQLFDIPNQIYE